MPSKRRGSEYRTKVTKDVNSLITEETLNSYAQRIRKYIGLKQSYQLDRSITVQLTETEKPTFAKLNLYDLIKIVSDTKIIERTPPTQSHCLESLETCLATYLNYSEILETGFKDEEQEFTNSYALFRGAVLARNQLRNNCVTKHEDNSGRTSLNLKNKPSDVIYDTTQVMFKLIETSYHKYKERHGGLKDELLIKAFDLLYTQIINQCIALEPAYKEQLKKTGLDAPHELAGIRFAGFEASDSRQEKLALPNLTLNMIVGNEEFIKKGERLVDNVLSYAFDAPNGGENPIGDFPQLLMSFGEPGTGKTITAYALLNYFAKLAKENNIPFLTKVIRKTDWTSSYQYASAKNLVNLFNEVFDFDGLAGMYWPDFDTACQARNSLDIRAEEKDNLNILFGLLDGTIGPRNGKWFIILDANYMDPKNMDKAIFSRLQEEVVEVKGPETKEHYITLFRDILLKDKKKFLNIKKENWEKFGKMCKKHELSGRAIEKISKQTAAYISDFKKPKGFLTMTYKEKLKVIEGRSKKVDPKHVFSTIEDYIAFQKNRDVSESFKKAEREFQELEKLLSKE